MSTLTKVVILFGIVVGVQFLVLAIGRFAEPDRSEAFVVNAMEFNRDARSKCAETLKEKTRLVVNEPFGTEGDGKSKVTLTWRGGDAAYDKIVCKYARDKGVTDLSVDGKSIDATD